MRLRVRNHTLDSRSYRCARVRSMFNSPSGATFELDAELPLEQLASWRLGLIVGPSGSGKSSLGRLVFGRARHRFYEPGGQRWPRDVAIVDAIAPDGAFDDVTAALAAVGLGTVPSWLRPYHVLSTGERFRADLARIVSEAPPRIVIDEFTSVVDRQIAKVGALAFAKAWRRTGGQAVLLSCHYDIVEWVQPDWVYDTATGEFRGREGLQPRPPINLEITRTGWEHWPLFEPHHYLKLPRMPASCCYLGTVDGQPVAHVAVSSRPSGRGRLEARACRLVIMPEWQGAGVGMRFLNHVCELQRRGRPGARLEGRPVTTLFHTSHPGLVAALRRDCRWRQVSAVLHGGSKRRSAATLRRSGSAITSGYGGHFRAVQGFRYVGEGPRR